MDATSNIAAYDIYSILCNYIRLYTHNRRVCCSFIKTRGLETDAVELPPPSFYLLVCIPLPQAQAASLRSIHSPIPLKKKRRQRRSGCCDWIYRNKGTQHWTLHVCISLYFLSLLTSAHVAHAPLTHQQSKSLTRRLFTFDLFLLFCRSLYLLNKGVTYSLFFCWYLLSKQNRRQQKTPWKNQPYYWSGYIESIGDE